MMYINKEKLRHFLVVLLTLVFAMSILPVIPARAAKGVEDFVISENEDEGEDEGDDEEDDEEKLTPEQIAAQKKAEEERLAALKRKKEALEKEVEKLISENKPVNNILSDAKNDEAIKESEYLIEKKLEVLLSDKKPNYSEIGSWGKELCNKVKDSSIGFYAQGLEAMNKKKPNLKQALQNFDKARKAKNPYKDAEAAYNSCWLKSNLVLLIVIVVIVLVVIGVGIKFAIPVIKAKIAAKKSADTESNSSDIDLQKLLNEDSSENSSEGSSDDISLQTSINEPSNANNLNNSNPINEVSPQKTVPEAKPVEKVLQNTNNTSSIKPQQTVQQNNASFKEENSIKNESDIVASIIGNGQFNNNQVNLDKSINTSNSNDRVIEATNNTASEKSSPVKKVVRVVKKVKIRKDANGKPYVVSEETVPQNVVEEDDQRQSVENTLDLENVRNITKPSARPVPPIDEEIDQIWENLSHKAMQGHIEQMSRKQDYVPSKYDNFGYRTNESSFSKPKNEYDFNIGDVSIDLSEDALKDDLVGKLKMMAITDAELRELFAQKNHAHIPHLIEYVLTKPEPIRLAFIAKEIGNYADPAVVDVLASLLYHDDERVVLAAIQGLEATKLPEAVVPLCPFLRSEVPLYAQATRTALGKFGAVKIMQALKDLPTFTDDKIKEAGIFVLSRMRGEPVENILKALLQDASSEIRVQAILAMSYQKNPAYIDTLRDFYRTSTNENEKSMTRKAIVYLNGFKS